jgi:hypothetical protein
MWWARVTVQNTNATTPYAANPMTASNDIAILSR